MMNPVFLKKAILVDLNVQKSGQDCLLHSPISVINLKSFLQQWAFGSSNESPFPYFQSHTDASSAQPHRNLRFLNFFFAVSIYKFSERATNVYYTFFFNICCYVEPHNVLIIKLEHSAKPDHMVGVKET